MMDSWLFSNLLISIFVIYNVPQWINLYFGFNSRFYSLCIGFHRYNSFVGFFAFNQSLFTSYKKNT